MDRLELILDLIKEHNCTIGAEVGVCQGALSKQLLSRWVGKLYLVDAWRHIPGLVDFNNPDHNGHLNNMAHTFMNVYDFGARAAIIRDTSLEASKLFPDGSLDFVYIDAGHDKKSVAEDLLAWYPKVKDGGLVIGDDYYDGAMELVGIQGSYTMFEVKTAVDEFAATVNKEVHVQKVESNGILPQFWIIK